MNVLLITFNQLPKKKAFYHNHLTWNTNLSCYTVIRLHGASTAYHYEFGPKVDQTLHKHNSLWICIWLVDIAVRVSYTIDVEYLSKKLMYEIGQWVNACTMNRDPPIMPA